MMVSVPGGLRGTGVLGCYAHLGAYVAGGEARPEHQTAMLDHLGVFSDNSSYDERQAAKRA
jgi:glutathione S-transferase